MPEEKYTNFQCFRLVKTEKKTGGTILVESSLGMVKKSFDDSNAFLDSKIIINIQDSDKNNKKVSSIPFFFSLPQIFELVNVIRDGSLSKSIAITKIDELAKERAKLNNNEKFFEEYAEVRDEILKLPARLDIEEFKAFNQTYKFNKMPYFDSVLPVYMGGTLPETAKRNDKKAQARMFEICPGSMTDIILVAKTGPGKINQVTGGIILEKVEKTLRFPMTYSEFSQMILTIEESAKTVLIKQNLF